MEEMQRRRIVLVFNRSWNQIEEFGVWSREPTAQIEFRVDAPAGRKVQVYLEVSPPPTISRGRLVAECMSQNARRSIVPLGPSTRRIAVECETGSGGIVTLVLKSEGCYRRLDDDRRQIYIGANRLGFVFADDVDARLRMIESFVFR
jgi:hypothetical protein